MLVVEDDPKDRAWLLDTLTAAGYRVETAAKGTEALLRCRQEAYDAITLDLLLPDISGHDLLKAIRGTRRNRATPVIVVTVVSEKEVGAGFHVHDILTKPIEAADLVASLHRAGVEAAGSPPILVVDDDPKALKLADRVLRDLGYRPTCRSDVESALQAAAAEAPAAVVLDLVMPKVDGFEFLRRFRNTPAWRGTPVIVWTVKDLTRTERERLRAATQAVVHKGRGTEALVGELRAHVPATRAGAS